MSAAQLMTVVLSVVAQAISSSQTRDPATSHCQSTEPVTHGGVSINNQCSNQYVTSILCSNLSRNRLPSFLKRNASKSKCKKAKPAVVTVYHHDFICLPSSYNKQGKSISIPRGKSRIRLAEMGLQGKVTFNSTMKMKYLQKQWVKIHIFPSPFFKLQAVEQSLLLFHRCPIHSIGHHKKFQDWEKHVFIFWPAKLATEDVKVCIYFMLTFLAFILAFSVEFRLKY